MSYKYMIHTCNARRWYVNEFLIPSMLEQGIEKDEIIVMVDSRNEGILMSTMKTFDWIGRTQDWNDIIWHLQDDVIISSNFKNKTNELYGDIICGFCSRYDQSKRYGLVDEQEMWYSFPCIGIKNYIAKECARWFFESAIYDDHYKQYIELKKYVDTFFRDFINYIYKKPIRIFNTKPNLVDHVDYLIGGSLVNVERTEKQVRAWYWEDEKSVHILEESLSKRQLEATNKN